MIKRPFLRTDDIEVALKKAPAELAELAADFEEYGRLRPDASLITDFQITGDYARGTADLRCDIDVNIAVSDQPLSQQLIEANPEQMSVAKHFLRTLMAKYGLIIDAKRVDPDVRQVAYKRCLSLREMKMYGTERRKMSKDVATVQVRELVKPQHHAPSVHPQVWDEERGEMVPLDPAVNDPYLADVSRFRKLYGKHYLGYGETKETAHLKR